MKGNPLTTGEPVGLGNPSEPGVSHYLEEAQQREASQLNEETQNQ